MKHYILLVDCYLLCWPRPTGAHTMNTPQPIIDIHCHTAGMWL